MSLKTVAIFALASVALAQPHAKRHFHFHGSGTGAAFPTPTGGPFSSDNSTDGNSPYPASSSASTVTLSPLPSSSEVDAASPTSCSTTMTTTVTSMDYETVTVDARSPDSTSVVAGAFYGGHTHSWGGYTWSQSSVAASSSAPAAVPTSFVTSMTSAAGGFSSVASVGFSSVAPGAISSVAPGDFSSVVPEASSMVSSATPSMSSTPSTGGSTSGKKGLSYNNAALTDAFAGDGISWAYNWAASEGGTILSGAEYVPLLWGASSVSGWASAAQVAISAGSSHVLSFNEPDLSSQSNLSPSDAAALHKANMGSFGSGVQVGSPAVTNGGGSSPPMGTTWLQQFFEACDGGCKVDFVAFHYYADTNLQNFQNHVNDVISTAQSNGVSKVWLTEFGVSGDDSDVASFLTQATAWLDQQSAVERYAYFMCTDGILLDGTSLSALGQAYAA